MESLLASLMIWIGTHTIYNVNEIPHPEVRLLSPQEMTKEYYSGTDFLRSDASVDSRIFALYNVEDAANGIIFLLDPRLNSELKADSVVTSIDRSMPLDEQWLENPVFQERLLHELIHHVQYQTDAVDKFPCPAFGEKEAYLLGGKFLQLRGITDPLPNRKVLAYMISRC